jgi:hypothetical protein
VNDEVAWPRIAGRRWRVASAMIGLRKVLANSVLGMVRPSASAGPRFPCAVAARAAAGEETGCARGATMRWHWSGVIRLIAIIVGLGVGILDKFVLGSGWIPAIGLTILVFLAIPFIAGLVWEAVERLMANQAALRRLGRIGTEGHRPPTHDTSPPFSAAVARGRVAGRLRGRGRQRTAALHVLRPG